jgi:hypothetical protein
MLVLSGVFNTRILVATNYTYICLHYALMPWIWPNCELAEWSIIVHCHLLVKLGF